MALELEKIFSPPPCVCAGLAVTSATVVIFGTAVRDPVQLLSQLQQPAAVCLALFGEC
jgi:cytosine/uracil/thiamine/allantoin permease